MKKVNLLLAAVVAASVSAPAVADYTPNVQFGGYFRSGVASEHTAKGNDHVHRFGRLGYEQDTYAEVTLSADLAKIDDTVWSVQSRVAYSSGYNRDWQAAWNKDQTKGDYSNKTEQSDVALREFNLSVKGLLDFDKDANVWVGKKFYRKDLHITDMYYWDISGMGAGIENLSVGPGKLSLAWLRRDDGDVNYRFDAAPTGKIQSTSSYASAHFFDVQYSFSLWDGANLALCETYIQKQSDDNNKITAGYVGYDDTTNEINSVKGGYGNSSIFALEFTQGFSSGWNKTVLQWTHGSTAKWGAFGSPVWFDRDGTSDSANRYVFINTGDAKLASNFGIYHVLYATYSSGYDADNSVTREGRENDRAFQLVVRPYLVLTKMTRLYAEAGFSTESKKECVGLNDFGVAEYKTTNAKNQKYTLAYAITPDASNFWSRPEIRLYATYVHSNENGQNLAAYSKSQNTDNTIANYDEDGKFVGFKTGDYYKNHNFIFGVQAEAWW